MQKLSRTCLVKEHNSTAIQYVCIYPQCQLSRFVCSKCLLGTIHKHNQKDNSHIVNEKDFQDKIKNKLISKGMQQESKHDIQKSVVALKQFIQEMQDLLKNFQSIILQLEQGILSNVDINHLEKEFLNLQKHGFNKIDEQSLNNLMNLYQQDSDIYKKILEQSNLILENVLKFKQLYSEQVQNKQKPISQQIQDAKYQIQQIDDTCDQGIYTGAISNDLQFIVSGGFDELVKIWDYQTNNQIQQIKLNDSVWSCKFTEDSTLLYAGTNKYIYQFDVRNQFKELYKSEIHQGLIFNIFCISNTIILTSSWDKAIIKTDIDKKQQLLKIQAHNNYISGLDYNKKLNIIASGAGDKSIKLWNGIDGSLILQKLNAHNNRDIEQVFFIINNNQLISLDDYCKLMIWNINYQTKQLEQVQLIENFGYNVSLVLQQQYIVATGRKFIKVYSIQGEFIRSIDHDVENYCQEYFYDLVCFNTTQLDSMKAILIKGSYKLQVCKLDII